METKEAGDLPDVVLIDVQRFGASDDMQHALLLCQAWQAGQHGLLTVEVPLRTVPNVVTALFAAQGVAAELQAASSAAPPATPRPLLASGVTAAEMPSTTPTSPAPAVVSFLLGGAWLHVQLTRPDALTLQAQLARVLGPG